MVATSNVSTTTPGSAVRYTVTLSNTGQTVVTTGAAVALTGVLDDATFNNDAEATAGRSRLSVRGSGSNFTPLSDHSGITVHSQPTPTGPNGSVLSNDYRIQIPFVAADTYSTTLTYIAGTQ